MKKQSALCGAALLIPAVSCTDRDYNLIITEEPDNPAISCTVVESTNDITTPTVGTEGKVYVIKNKNVTVRNTSLSIEPRVIVKCWMRGYPLIIASGTSLHNTL